MCAEISTGKGDVFRVSGDFRQISIFSVVKKKTQSTMNQQPFFFAQISDHTISPNNFPFRPIRHTRQQKVFKSPTNNHKTSFQNQQERMKFIAEKTVLSQSTMKNNFTLFVNIVNLFRQFSWFCTNETTEMRTKTPATTCRKHNNAQSWDSCCAKKRDWPEWMKPHKPATRTLVKETCCQFFVQTQWELRT